MRYFSLFSGIGGFELGIQQAYENYLKLKHLSEESEPKERSQGRKRIANKRGKSICLADGTAPLCVGYSEVDKYAIQIYQKHFSHKNYGDITKIDPATLPDFDLICGGFPCQSFSIAGKRGGFNDTRGTLFFDIARLARVKRPKVLFLENVKGLLSHDGGRTFDTIIRTLDELGYDCEWQVLNSKNFGVPQNRERMFIIGHLRGQGGRKIFPIGENGEIPIQTLRRQRTADATLGRNLSQGAEQAKTIFHQTTNQSGLRQIRKLPDNSDSRGGQTYPANLRIRRLTPKECERLQGFPDDWTEGISDTQRYKCLGNAVTVNVIKAIAERLF